MRRLVIIPPFAGSERMLEPFLEQLRPTLQVTVLEPPGFGGAPSPEGLPSVRTLAKAALALWDEAGVGRANLFGLSLGGMIAQWMALEAPERVERLILASTADTGLSAIVHASLHHLGAAGSLLQDEADATAALAADVLGDGVSDEIAAHVDRALHTQPRPKSDLLWLAAAAASHDARDRMPELQMKTLVLSGGADDLIPAEVQAELTERLANARQVVLPGVGHDVTLEAPDRSAAAVIDFLDAG